MALFDGNRPSKASWHGWEKWWWALLTLTLVTCFPKHVALISKAEGEQAFVIYPKSINVALAIGHMELTAMIRLSDRQTIVCRAQLSNAQSNLY